MIEIETPTDADRNALGEIEAAVAAARSGEISSASAFARIEALARDAQGGEIYQKPWG